MFYPKAESWSLPRHGAMEARASALQSRGPSEPRVSLLARLTRLGPLGSAPAFADGQVLGSGFGQIHVTSSRQGLRA